MCIVGYQGGITRSTGCAHVDTKAQKKNTTVVPRVGTKGDVCDGSGREMLGRVGRSIFVYSYYYPPMCITKDFSNSKRFLLYLNIIVLIVV